MSCRASTCRALPPRRLQTRPQGQLCNMEPGEASPAVGKSAGPRPTAARGAAALRPQRAATAGTHLEKAAKERSTTSSSRRLSLATSRRASVMASSTRSRSGATRSFSCSGQGRPRGAGRHVSTNRAPPPPVRRTRWAAAEQHGRVELAGAASPEAGRRPPRARPGLPPAGPPPPPPHTSTHPPSPAPRSPSARRAPCPASSSGPP